MFGDSFSSEEDALSTIFELPINLPHSNVDSSDDYFPLPPLPNPDDDANEHPPLPEGVDASNVEDLFFGGGEESGLGLGMGMDMDMGFGSGLGMEQGRKRKGKGKGKGKERAWDQSSDEEDEVSFDTDLIGFNKLKVKQRV